MNIISVNDLEDSAENAYVSRMIAKINDLIMKAVQRKHYYVSFRSCEICEYEFQQKEWQKIVDQFGVHKDYQCALSNEKVERSTTITIVVAAHREEAYWQLAVDWWMQFLITTVPISAYIGWTVMWFKPEVCVFWGFLCFLGTIACAIAMADFHLVTYVPMMALKEKEK
jgi:hypothetical protein